MVGLLAKRPSIELLQKAKAYRPKFAVTFDTPDKDWLTLINNYSIFIQGEEGLAAIIEESDKVLNAVSGLAGIKPALRALEKKKILLACNKESIVFLEDIIRKKINLVIPVDSEHNALFFLLKTLNKRFVDKLILTASGGPFKNLPVEKFSEITPEQALRHPTWQMGPKVSIDCATLMNKGIEILEAKILFGCEPDNIEVIIHPQSFVHAGVKLEDGSYILYAANPTMKLPLLHALFYPEVPNCQLEETANRLVGSMSFEEPNEDKFPALKLCRWIAKAGGAYPPALIGADQKALELFLQGMIKFNAIVPLVEEVINLLNSKPPETEEETLEIVSWGYIKAEELAQKFAV